MTRDPRCVGGSGLKYRRLYAEERRPKPSQAGHLGKRQRRRNLDVARHAGKAGGSAAAPGHGRPTTELRTPSPRFSRELVSRTRRQILFQLEVAGRIATANELRESVTERGARSTVGVCGRSHDPGRWYCRGRSTRPDYRGDKARKL